MVEAPPEGDDPGDGVNTEGVVVLGTRGARAHEVERPLGAVLRALHHDTGDVRPLPYSL